jgi:hypothetical protein
MTLILGHLSASLRKIFPTTQYSHLFPYLPPNLAKFSPTLPHSTSYLASKILVQAYLSKPCEG